ncbi:uncharacterized secreted protein [Rhizobium leguminosarum bv. trifolii WSM2297]|uniref:Uncharacterized secreted protein n=1 Tax=Rhizobium leguminosarum bv. trifolii WSM2297 TaxID=754762 RepID=J0W261_RHILT|nr:DUF1223 domain-containing protein [Rhizobium leguminosarum]EJC79786.1 uncharacterized secreted protein [Rhizobium leguminosarum bv. trifolii WSM2297]
MKHSTAFTLPIITAILGLGTLAPASAGQSPAVVELFTSQGCSSCPPANANLVKLSNDPNVLALSFSVTYWDYLGWKDIFGKPEFTERQVSYEPALGQSGPFTPQMVINGHLSTVGNDLNEIRSTLASEPALTGPEIKLSGDAAMIDAAKGHARPADIWLVRYAKGTVEVPVARGENAGETLPHAHVVHALTHLGTWRGKASRFTIPAATDDLSTAILLQEKNSRRIVAAATD